jgi:hypothetical protein
MLLTADEHCIGRLVEDARFKIESNAVSANHCKIYRRRLNADDSSEHTVFLKDTRFVHCSSKVLSVFFFFLTYQKKKKKRFYPFFSSTIFLSVPSLLQHKWDISQLGEVEEE